METEMTSNGLLARCIIFITCDLENRVDRRPHSESIRCRFSWSSFCIECIEHTCICTAYTYFLLKHGVACRRHNWYCFSLWIFEALTKLARLENPAVEGFLCGACPKDWARPGATQPCEPCPEGAVRVDPSESPTNPGQTV